VKQNEQPPVWADRGEGDWTGRLPNQLLPLSLLPTATRTTPCLLSVCIAVHSQRLRVYMIIKLAKSRFYSRGKGLGKMADLN
jgi:hypothetical protein